MIGSLGPSPASAKASGACSTAPAASAAALRRPSLTFPPDVNVLVYAHRTDAPEHRAYAEWLTATVSGREPFAMSELVMSGFLRIVTHRKVFRSPTPLERAIEFLEEVTAQPHCRVIRPGPRHWPVFMSLCRATGATDKLIADAFHAATAIEHGCEWIIADSDFGRFAGLRWSHPLRR